VVDGGLMRLSQPASGWHALSGGGSTTAYPYPSRSDPTRVQSIPSRKRSFSGELTQALPVERRQRVSLSQNVFPNRFSRNGLVSTEKREQLDRPAHMIDPSMAAFKLVLTANRESRPITVALSENTCLSIRPTLAFADQTTPRVITFDKPCRFDRVRENVLSMVCRTCWSDICGCRRPTIARQSISSETRSSQPASIIGICIPTRHPVPETIDRG